MKGFQVKSKLTHKLLWAISISLVGSLLILTVITRAVGNAIDHYNANIDLSEISHIYFYIIFFILFVIVIVSFISIFLLLARSKLTYLKHITESINDIAKGDLSLRIDIKGRDELTQLAYNINGMSKDLEHKFEHERQLERVKNELITNISHDLRTPLTSIIGYLGLLKKGQHQSQAQYQDYLEITYSKSLRLKHLIDELFDYTRLSGPDVNLNLNEVDLSALLQQIVGEYIPLFEKENLTVIKTIPIDTISIMIDIEKMVRVYENLFMNVIKYSIKPSEIKITLEVKKYNAIVMVQNRAHKPPVADMNQLFDRFFRANSTRSDNSGSGLGLAIAKRIVELHKGIINAKYEEGWIHFSVELPTNTEKLHLI
ncbi:sensor histidine kinase [Paenibacillus endoradicis]|uniref:sensor histidine kinase n=1 Tax=Paenibacillus endoradicis TaxID=2972487 RepID=UPI002159543C|nr:HAMP domain-containing sensor histidine kinase [Paenibacillus endoradicis]MCR8656582.1 HAMP domain-containing histidine kinase [Paenibacillus endoradicis]